MNPPGDSGSPRQFVGYLLRRAFVVSRISAEACLDTDITLQEVPVLTLVDAMGTLSQRALAQLLVRSSTTTAKLLDSLIAHGWVERTRDERDRRSYALTLTPSGRAEAAHLHDRLDLAERRLTRTLTERQRSRLATGLRLLLQDDPTIHVPRLGERCGYLIVRAHGLLMRQAAEAFSGLGISPKDFGILLLLDRLQPCSQQHLAEALLVSAPAVLRFVDELESRGLVGRRRRTDDRRVYDVTLTAEGTRVLRAAQRLARSLQAGIVDTLGERRDAEVRHLLEIIIDSASESEPADSTRGASREAGAVPEGA